MALTIGVISDTHLTTVTREFEELCDLYLSDADFILHAGDVVSEEIVDYLDGNGFYGVQGNMDPPEVRERLPLSRVVNAGRFRLGLIHGWGSPGGLEDRVRSRFADVDAIVFGHSHRAVNVVREGVVYFNPGTATGYSSSGIHSIGILEVGESIRGRIITL